MSRTLKEWKGNIAEVYEGKIDWNTLEKDYTIFYVDNGRGRPMKVKDFPELVNKPYDTLSGNRFSVYILGKTQQGDFLPAITEYIPIKVTDISAKEQREYIRYLKDKKGYIEIPYYKRIKMSDVQIFMGSKDWDEVYKKLPGAANNLYDFLGDNYIFHAPGFVLTTKDFTIKSIIDKKLQGQKRHLRKE